MKNLEEENIMRCEEQESFVSVKTKVPDINELDKIIESIPFGISHFCLVMILSYFCFVDGYIMISISLVMPQLEDDWKLSSFMKTFLSGCIFIGFMVGSLICGVVSFRGRILAFQIGVFISFVGSFLAYVTNSPESLSFHTFFIGLGLGVGLPSAMALIPEIANSKIRCYMMTYVCFFFPVGEITACMVAKHSKIFLSHSEGWRNVFLWRCIFLFCVWPLSFLLKEGPRFLISIKRYKEAFDILENLMGEDKKSLTEERKNKIINQYEDFIIEKIDSENKPDSLETYYDLLSKDYAKQSLSIFGIYFFLSLLYYGLIYALPLVFTKLEKENGMKNKRHEMSEEQFSNIMFNVIISCMFELPINILAGILPNVKSLGRVRTMMLGFLICLVGFVCSFFFPEILLYCSSLTKGAITIPFLVIVIYTAEIYPSILRVTALGIGNFFCRLGGFIAPFICEVLFRHGALFPFVGFAFFSALALLLTICLDKETLGKQIY